MSWLKLAFVHGDAADWCAVVLAALAAIGLLTLLALRRGLVTGARARFGELALVDKLIRGESPLLRRLSAGFALVGLVLLLTAALRPQAKSGTKLLPATTLDVVIVLDFSKSMYARDVLPDRISRAKLEVADLIRELPGARFGAVAFAGDAMSFPLSSDGAAINQFFRQLSPNDMPVGGTAIARALERAREVLARDPKSKDHERVIVLVTDGEDLEGDPARIAERCKTEGTRIDVVQIGGRTAEPIPDIDDNGAFVGLRRDRQGKTLTTQLSAAGEAQLSTIASTTGGVLIKSDKGSTGLSAITKGLRRKVREELSERAIVVWDELYTYPLALAFACLSLDLALPLLMVALSRRRAHSQAARRRPKEGARA